MTASLGAALDKRASADQGRDGMRPASLRSGGPGFRTAPRTPLLDGWLDAASAGLQQRPIHECIAERRPRFRRGRLVPLRQIVIDKKNRWDRRRMDVGGKK